MLIYHCILQSCTLISLRHFGFEGVIHINKNKSILNNDEFKSFISIKQTAEMPNDALCLKVKEINKDLIDYVFHSGFFNTQIDTQVFVNKHDKISQNILNDIEDAINQTGDKGYSREDAGLILKLLKSNIEEINHVTESLLSTYKSTFDCEK